MIADQMALTVLLMRHKGYSEVMIAQELERVFTAVCSDGIWTPEAVTALKHAAYEATDKRLTELLARVDPTAVESSTKH